MSNPATVPSHPPPRHRIAIAIGIGIAAAGLAFAFLSRPGSGGDYFFVWSATRSLFAGQNPYHIIAVGPENPGNDVLLYPLPALLIIAPFAWLPLAASGAAFLGISSAILAFVVTRDGYYRLPLFMSAPFVMAVSLGQWSPLVTAAALEANLGFVFAAKPNLGLGAWIYRPTVRSIVIAAALVGVSLIVAPTWPLDWYHNISSRPEKLSPIRTTLGPLLLLGLIRWRRADARLVVAMACIPQALFFYDQLLLGLVPRTFRQSLLLSLFGFGALLIWFYRLQPGDLYVQKAIPYATAIYFAALAVVLWPRTPNADAGSPVNDVPSG